MKRQSSLSESLTDTSGSYPIPKPVFIPIFLTQEGAIRRVAKRVREFASNQRGIRFYPHSGSYAVTLTPLEFWVLNCPQGNVLRMTGEYAFQEKEPTSQDMSANCVHTGS